MRFDRAILQIPLLHCMLHSSQPTPTKVQYIHTITKSPTCETMAMTRWQLTIVILVTLTHMTGYVTGNPIADNASENTTAQISTKHTPVATFVFVDHTGPYWNLSHTIEALTAYMKQHEQVGSIIIRYEGQPKSNQFFSHMRVGFQIQDDFDAQPPYQLVHDEASLIVTATMNAGSLSPVRGYTQLRDWARLHELDIIGPFTEIYTSPQASDVATVELHLGVREKSKQPFVTHAPTTKHPEKVHEPLETLTTSTTKPQAMPKDMTDITIDQADNIPTPTMSNELPSIKKSPTDSDRQNELIKAHDAPVPIEATTPSRRESKTNKLPVPREEPTSFEPVANLLFSTFAEGKRDNHEQLAKLVARIQAIATGANQRYPGQAQQLKQLAEVMTLKLEQYTNQTLPSKSKSQPVQTIAFPDPQLVRATQQLEIVMGKMGYRTMLPKQALIRVLTIIRQAVEESTYRQTRNPKSIKTP